jgi:hypothetical protein
MATYVESDDLKVVIDPAAALGPRRYGMAPHPLELRRLQEIWADIKKHAAKSDILVVTHYHYDHHDPEEGEVFRDKTVYLKDPKKNINKSQQVRASYFLNKLDGLTESTVIADGKEFQHGSTVIKFSPPVFHGTNSRLGYVLEVSISCCDEKLVYTSDVEGASIEEQAAFIIEENPDLLILDGPMTYMLGYRYSSESLKRSIENINRIVRETSVRDIILDHHFMRDLNYKEHIGEVYEYATENGVRVLNAAEYVGRATEMLEARRKELYGH